MKNKLDFLIKSAEKTFHLLLLVGLSHLILLILTLAIGVSSINFLMWNPFTKGFIHVDVEHLTYNLLIIFFLLLFPINRDYNSIKLLLITFVLCTFGIVFDLMTNEPSVGISNTLYFLFARACLSPRKWWGYLLFGLIIYPEIFHVVNFSDGISQHNHLIGALFGILSMNRQAKSPFNILKPKKNQITLAF